MAKQNATSAATDFQSLFDPKGYQDVFKTWASINERMASLAVETGTRVTDIASETTKEALANIRELSEVRDEPSQYGQAYTDFIQKQAELFTRAGQTFANESRKLGSETADLATEAGEEVNGKIAANTESAAKTARSAAKKAA